MINIHERQQEIFILVNPDLETCNPIGWQDSRQPIRSHASKSLLTNVDFNMDFMDESKPELTE